MDSERIPRSLLRGLASELPKMTGYLAWKIPCTLVQGASNGGSEPPCGANKWFPLPTRRHPFRLRGGDRQGLLMYCQKYGIETGNILVLPYFTTLKTSLI